MNIDLRPTTDRDYDWLFELKRVSMMEYVEKIFGWDESVQSELFGRNFQPEAISIVTVDGCDAGMVETEETPTHLFLKRIEILPEFQKQGIGTRIISKLVADARAGSLPTRLRVFKINPARNLYRRLGFRVVGETALHLEMETQVPNPQKANPPAGGSPLGES